MVGFSRLLVARDVFANDEPRTSFGFGEGRSFFVTTGFGRDCDSGWRAGFRLLRIPRKLTPPAPGEVDHAARIAGVEEIGCLEPSLAGHANADDDIIERIHRVCIGP